MARAGGRCLDVVRLLRITTASPSVEATSMRCQAVLEALRGRFDVSRSMLASSRTALEELGLRHGLLETDLFTGMVELIAGDPRGRDRARCAPRTRGSARSASVPTPARPPRCSRPRCSPRARSTRPS